jgi:phosphopantetheinyl transferase (holo-ACP synthase)
VLSDAELATWRARSQRWPERGMRYLATRFSAKEAFSKAMGLGMRMPMTWRACEVNLPSGQPSSCCMAASGVVRGTALRPTSPSPTKPTTPPAFVSSSRMALME